MIFKKRERGISSWLPRLQCHRGYWIEGFPQNSLKSIQAAYQRGYQMCEFDVRLTSDKYVILFHDPEINGKKISNLTLEEFKFENGDFTLLDEILEWLCQVDLFKINIEIKSKEVVNFDIERQICDLVSYYHLDHRVLISSFNPFSLAKVRFFNSNIFRALLLSYEDVEENKLLIKSMVLNPICEPDAIHLRLDDYFRFKNFFRNKALHIPIVIWTLNDINVLKNEWPHIHGAISDEIKPSDIKNFLS